MFENPVSKKNQLKNHIIGLFIFGLFDKNRVSALAEKIRSIYHDPKIQEDSASYVFETLSAA